MKCFAVAHHLTWGIILLILEMLGGGCKPEVDMEFGMSLLLLDILATFSSFVVIGQKKRFG